MTELISRKHGNDLFEVIIKTTDEVRYEAAMAYARLLVGSAKPPLNGDIIRRMTDEELGAFLIRITDYDANLGYCKNTEECEKLLDTEEGIPAEKCAQCMLDWLRQPSWEGR